MANGSGRNMLHTIMKWACQNEMESWKNECKNNTEKKNECAEHFVAIAENIGGSTSSDESNIFMKHAYSSGSTKIETAKKYFNAHLYPCPNDSQSSKEVEFKYVTATPDCRIYWPMEHLVNIQLILFEVKSISTQKHKDKLRFRNDLVRGLLYSQKTAGVMLYPNEFIFIELLRCDDECEIRYQETTYNLTDEKGNYVYNKFFQAQKHIANLVREARLRSPKIKKEYKDCSTKVPEFTKELPT